MLANTKPVTVEQGGRNKPGYCKVCALSIVDEVDRRLRASWTVPQVMGWIAKYPDDMGNPVTVDRRVLYRHRKEHIGHPKDRLVSLVQRSKQQGLMQRPKVSAEEYTQAITELAMKRAIDNPDEVTIRDGLAAAKMQMARPEKVTNLALVFANVVLGGSTPLSLPEPTMEGEFIQVE